MILVFPTLQPEELLYSACARYSELFQFPGGRSVAQGLFGTHQATAVLDLPLGIQTFVERLPRQSYTVEDVISRHTTLPYYAHFLSPERLAGITARMREGRRGPVPHTLLGAGRGRVSPPSHLLYCPSCADDDLRSVGEPCWRRVHQLPAVYLCPDHGTPLLRGPVRRKDLVRVFEYHSLRAALVGGPATHEVPAGDPAKLQWLSQSSLRLLQTDARALTPGELRERHRAQLRRFGLLSPRGAVDVPGAERLLIQHWGDSLLKSIGLHPASPERRTSWVGARAGAAPRESAGHPLLHLLLVGAYGISLEEFLDGQEQPQTAEDAVAPSSECANPACPAYLPPERRQAARRAYYRTGGAWTCGKCGACYEEFSAHCGVRFLQTGPLWDAEFRRLVQAGASVRELQTWCGMRYDLMLCHAARLDVWRSQWGERTKFSLADRRVRTIAERDRRRAEYLQARAGAPDVGRNTLRRQLQAVWSWLRANDNAWLLAHTPACAKREAGLVGWVDWLARDRELQPRVDEAIRALREAVPPVRLTTAAIGRKAGVRLLIVRERGRLPLTAAAVRKGRESIPEFTRRRVQWQVAEHIQAGNIPYYSDFVERCGIEWRNRRDYEVDINEGLRQIDASLAPPEPTAI
jgi:hypothetical protein